MGQTSILAKTPKFTLEMDLERESVLFRLSGTVDEDSPLMAILDVIKQSGAKLSEVQFDLGQVVRMNSCGIREWLLVMERLPKSTVRTFFNVNEIFVEQVNMIPSMLGGKGAQIISFEAPYRCDACSMDMPILLDPNQVKFDPKTAAPQAPEMKCPKCGGVLEFAWLVEEYFAFLKRI